MNQIRGLLRRVRHRLVRDRALGWGIQGTALAALLALGFEALQRRWPVDPAWPGLAACAGIGLGVGLAGWLRAWPSWEEAARVADRRLGGQERLTTALQFAGEGSWIYARQRADAAAFADRADLTGLGPVPIPVPWLVVGVAAVVAVATLAFLPNPALQQLRTQRSFQMAQTQAAGQVDALAKQAASQA